MNDPWKTIKLPEKDVNALRVDGTHPLDLFWAKDHLGRYLFIYEYPQNLGVIIKNPPDLEGIQTISMNAETSVSRLILVLKEKSDWELFLALCIDVLNSTRSVKTAESATNKILQRLRRWQTFLKKKRLNILSEEKIKGLIGELLFMKNHLIPRFGAGDTVKFWLGPQGSPQDFTVNNCAVEVKCQVTGTIPSVKINSADQLFSQQAKLFLFVVTLGKTTSDNNNAINLPSLISELTDCIEQESSTALSVFQDLLLECDYYHNQKYYEYNYLLLEENVYSVIDEFPRICPGDLLSGIMKLSYNISLAECTAFEVRLSEWSLGEDE